MEGLASLSVKSMLPTSSCWNIAQTKEYLVDIEKREVKEGDDHHFQDKKQTLLLKLTETVSRNQISIVAHGYVNSIIKEMLKFYDHLIISVKNLLGTKPLWISVLISVEPSNIVRSIKGFLNPTPSPPPPPRLPGQTDVTINDLVTAAPGSASGIPKCKDYGTTFKQAENAMLILAMLTAAATFSAACAFAGVVSRDGETARDYYSSLAGPFVLLNSVGFIAAVAVIMSVLNQLPLKPWPQISVGSWFLSYMCLMMKLSPHEALLLLCVSVPVLVLAATGNLFKFSKWV